MKDQSLMIKEYFSDIPLLKKQQNKGLNDKLVKESSNLRLASFVGMKNNRSRIFDPYR